MRWHEMLCPLCMLGLAFLPLAWSAEPTAKVFAAGSGLSMMSLNGTTAAIIALSGQKTPPVLYLVRTIVCSASFSLAPARTATYDDPRSQQTQTQGFLDAGCTVSALRIAVARCDRTLNKDKKHSYDSFDSDSAALVCCWLERVVRGDVVCFRARRRAVMLNVSYAEMAAAFERAAVVLVSGGNTLYAINRWQALGVDKLLQKALRKGTVLAGGSAGAIVSFEAGHSDSMDPTSYKNPPGPLLNPEMSEDELKNWAYIRVPALGFFPGLVCPHYDQTQSNGVLRAYDFTGMLQRHSGETGIGIDEWAAIVIKGDSFSIVSTPDKPGSVAPDGTWTPGPPAGPAGRPGVWRMEIDWQGALVRSLVPPAGHVKEIFRPARWTVTDPQVPVATRQNPADGLPPSPKTGQESKAAKEDKKEPQSSAKAAEKKAAGEVLSARMDPLHMQDLADSAGAAGLSHRSSHPPPAAH
eukprot:g17946.t1